MNVNRTGLLASSTAVGVVWLLFQGVGARIIGFASQIVLARLLVPTDFGMLGLASTVIAIVGVVTTFGVDDVLLQRQRTISYWTTPAFRMAVALGLTAFILVCIFSPLAAAIYRSPTLNQMLPIMALSMPIGALAMVPSVMLRASLQFEVLAKIAIVEQIVAQGLTIWFAWRGYGPLSFALPLPITAALRSGILWLIARPRFRPSRLGQHAHMFKQGGTVFASRLITAGVNQGDYALLGILASPAIVGTYFFAFRLAVQPIQMLAGNFQTVLFPALAQLQADPARQRDAAINASRILSGAVMPYCFLQAALARPTIDLLFGDKWHDAIPLVQILSVGLAFDAVSWLAGSLLSARGEFSRALKYSCLFSPIFFVAIAVGAAAGSATGVAIAVSLFYILLGPVLSYLVFRSYGLHLREVAWIYGLPGLIAAIAMGGGTFAESCLPPSHGPFVSIIAISGIGLVLYALMMRVFAPSLFFQVLNRVALLRKRNQVDTPLSLGEI